MLAWSMGTADLEQWTLEQFDLLCCAGILAGGCRPTRCSCTCRVHTSSCCLAGTTTRATTTTTPTENNTTTTSACDWRACRALACRLYHPSSCCSYPCLCHARVSWACFRSYSCFCWSPWSQLRLPVLPLPRHSLPHHHRRAFPKITDVAS